ncbi:hypothetical protein BDV95DRAFT_568256 [Massariosphaeria phaeospora]|uniref:DUF7730 domain-containing protein n=1 Tax=Massariosphaeria phaeospora TaxID=100035 RepID=A0A7C8IBE3_9PLEO|nr:hypothetical protein BDV95DRAFT_568256 [Massariosphaeria phaeospora]
MCRRPKRISSEDRLAIKEAKAVAVNEQPRQAANQPDRRALPHAGPRRQGLGSLLEQLHLDCRLLIWEHVLRTPHTRLERWRPPCDVRTRSFHFNEQDLDADCFPYRMTTAGSEKLEKPLALLLCCRQMYSEALPILYSSTTFVLSSAMDLHCFRLISSPNGFTRVRGLVITAGRVDWPDGFCSQDVLGE